MGNTWDFSTWGFFNLIAVLLASLLLAHMLKRMFRLWKNRWSPPRCWAA